MQILKEALYSIISGPGFDHKSFLSYLAAVHVIYREYQQEIMWLGQLTTLKPGILRQLPQTGYNKWKLYTHKKDYFYKSYLSF